MYILNSIENKKIAIIDLLTEKSGFFWNLTDKTIKKYIKLWKNILFITNKKWFSSSTICKDCWYILKCDYCDIPVAKYVNNDKYISMCPICKRIYESNGVCKKCWWTNIQEIWIWTYKLKEIIKNEYKIEPFIIENTNVNSLNKIKNVKSQLKHEKYVISTSILSSEISVYYPDLIIFFNADIWLSIPDFNVAEKNFLFLYEFIKKYSTSNFIIQTYNIEHYIYKYILNLDLDWFWKQELKYRKAFSYPPYSELAILKYKTEIEDSLYRKVSKLESELKYLLEKENLKIDIFPTPELIYKKFWKYHYNIILKWKNIKPFLDKAVKLLKIKEKWFQIDWLPSSLI